VRGIMEEGMLSRVTYDIGSMTYLFLCPSQKHHYSLPVFFLTVQTLRSPVSSIDRFSMFLTQYPLLLLYYLSEHRFDILVPFLFV